MTSSISPQNHGKIQELDNQIQEFIEQAKNGQQPDAKGVSSLVQQLSSLLQNPEVPENVKQSLQEVASALKQMGSGQGDVNNLFSAKMQLDSLLSEGESHPIEPASEAHGVGEGSLGGGGSEG